MLGQSPMTCLERFDACMEYGSADRRPNHELGVWKQTQDRFMAAAPGETAGFHWGWFRGEEGLGMDHREFIGVGYGFIPAYEEEVIEETAEYEIIRNTKGILSKALKAGTVRGQRASMNEYMDWPVKTPEDWPGVKKRLVAGLPNRYPKDLEEKIARWKQRDYPLCLGNNCAANGFYWRAREFMGTENLSYAWYDYPEMMHDMMEFFADFIIETSRPVLEKIRVDYFTFNEDMSMKTGPLLSPEVYRRFIWPHMKRIVSFLRSHGTRYVAVDTDGNPTLLVPMLMEAGVDTLWPLERAADISPMGLRKQFGKSLRLWGGVDKRVLAQGKKQINAHLREFVPLIEEGGFIPTVDHTVPPDVSWDNFRHYMDGKRALLAGEFGKLE